MDSLTDIISGLAELRPTLAEFYQDLHRHPELSMEETRTAAKAAERLRADGYQVTAGVGKTGVVGILEHGSGPTVMLRADMDALPVREQTGLAYASNVTAIDSEGQTVPVMHACGHDFHVTCLSGAASLLSSKRKRWAGRLMVVFQPAEETASGARAMLDDGLFDRFGNPDIILGQHVAPTPAGMLVWRAGVSMAAADSLEIVLFGRGGHSSRPQTCVDPVVMAAAVVMRLQGIVSREVAPDEQVVVTVGSLRAGTKENIIPDQASLKLNVRSFSKPVRDKVIDAIRRIAIAEATASGAPRPPEFRPIHSFPLLTTDVEATGRVVAAFTAHFGEARVRERPPVTASEDFGEFATAAKVPSVFWNFGGLNAQSIRAAHQAGRSAEIAGNHSPLFAPVIEPTISTGVEALIAAALVWLRNQ